MWTIIRFACSTIALIAFAIRLGEEKSPLLRAALMELVSSEAEQVRERVADLFDTEPSWK